MAIDAYVVMPNHFHGILRFGWETEIEDRRGRPPCLPVVAPTIDQSTNDVEGRNSAPIASNAPVISEGRHGGLPLRQTDAVSLGQVIQWFKSATTKDYAIGVQRFGWAPYSHRLWQRNYFEHVVRDERDLDRVRGYIDGNPGRWTEDEEYRG